MLIKNRDFVIIGLQQWFTVVGSTCKNIALEFSRHNRVLYVDLPLDRKTVLEAKKDPNLAAHLQIVREKRNDIRKIGHNLWNLRPKRVTESVNWLPSTSLFSWFNHLNNKRMAADIQEAIDELGFKDVIIFNDNDIFRGFYFKELLKPAKYVYLYRDFIIGVDYWKKHGETLEPKHIAKADVAVANTPYIQNICKKANPNSYCVGQGCNLDLFNVAIRHPMPEDVAAISGPRIGYVGALSSLRLDIDLLAYIAKSRPDFQLVLVGPEDEDFRNSELHSISNVHFLGRKEVSQLPSYIQSFDVCINPQIVNPITIGNYPLKIDEYLAMGKPTVATTTEAMSIFTDHVYLAADKAAYVTRIEQALREDTPVLQAERVRFAHTHSWENMVRNIYQAILSPKIA